MLRVHVLSCSIFLFLTFAVSEMNSFTTLKSLLFVSAYIDYLSPDFSSYMHIDRTHLDHRCKKRFFTFFYSGHVFYVFNVFNVFYFAFFFFEKILKIPSEITFETTETNWVCNSV